MKNDPINPNHYKGTKGFEAIDVMEAASVGSPDGFAAHVQCTAIKYLFRLWRKSNPLEDAKKAKWYLEQLIEHLEKMEAEDRETFGILPDSKNSETRIVQSGFLSREQTQELGALRMDYERGKMSRHQYETRAARIRGGDNER